MIFVTVGNATQGFSRLLCALDSLGQDGFFNDEPVIVQTGNNPPLQASCFQSTPFITMEDFEAFVAGADLIICHAGVGTLMHVLRQGKIPVVMPRRVKYDEIINDHQLQIAEAFAAENKIIPAYEPPDLKQAITIARENARTHGILVAGTQPLMINLIDQAIQELTYRR